jgi:uncharacterized protein YyaL (SSP411 family)
MVVMIEKKSMPSSLMREANEDRFDFRAWTSFYHPVKRKRSMSNQLKNATSPYLLQHAENPVDWVPWSQEALQQAKKQDKPIFLSIGYAACHWCHVMAHESFEDPETAAIMNEHFINIKVDREERPDIDAVYMDAVVAMTGQGGWPMSVFMTPKGEPFYGGTYFPPTPRYNMPSFKGLLSNIADAWKNDRESLESKGAQLTEHLTRTPSLGATDGGEQSLDPTLFRRSAEALFKQYDWSDGGWGSAPKFPQSLAADYLFRLYDRDQDKLAFDMAIHALRSMAKGGMYDLVGGGFHRYSVDEIWLVPHFEKMLYDNAQLAKTYIEAWQISGDLFYKEIAVETLQFMRRELGDPLGGFYSSLDADSEGKEGTYYLWREDEIRLILEDQPAADLIIRHFGITNKGNFEGENIPTRTISISDLAQEFNLEEAETQDILNSAKDKMLSHREGRIHPGLDDKVLASWNALSLSAFCAAARILSRSEYYPVAERLANFLTTEMIVDGKLMRSWRKGVANYNAYLEDHASLGLGLLDIYQLDFNPRWYEMAVDQAQEILEHFSDDRGGFFDTRDDHEDLIARPKGIQDTPTPSGNSMAIALLLRLGAYSGNQRYMEIAQSALAGMQENAARYPSAFGGWLCALDFAMGPQLQLAIIGSPESAGFIELAEVAHARYLPRMVIAGAAEATDSGPELLTAREMVDQLPTAFLCQGFACKLPTTSPESLAQQIEETRSTNKP